jgi:hypothetical protein
VLRLKIHFSRTDQQKEIGPVLIPSIANTNAMTIPDQAPGPCAGTPIGHGHEAAT